jgi:hypothetical protein
MVTDFHAGHETGMSVDGQILLRRGWSYLGVSEDRERAAHEAGQDGEPQRKYRGQSSLHGVQGCAHSKGIICLQTVESEALGAKLKTKTRRLKLERRKWKLERIGLLPSVP